MFNPLYFSFTKFILAPTKSKSMKESETKHTYDRKIDENIDAEFEPEIPQKPKIYEQDQGSTDRLVRRPTGPNRSEILKFSLVLVRFGPSFGPRFGPGPSWS